MKFLGLVDDPPPKFSFVPYKNVRSGIVEPVANPDFFCLEMPQNHSRYHGNEERKWPRGQGYYPKWVGCIQFFINYRCILSFSRENFHEGFVGWS